MKIVDDVPKNAVLDGACEFIHHEQARVVALCSGMLGNEFFWQFVIKITCLHLLLSLLPLR